MGLKEENSDAYQNLTHSLEKSTEIKGKWTLYLILCCLSVCSASFSFGYNIGSTNLPTQYIKDFYGQKYFKSKYLNESYMERVASYNIYKSYKNEFKDTCDFYPQKIEYFNKNVEIVEQLRSLKLNASYFEKYLNDSCNQTELNIKEFEFEHSFIEDKNKLLWIITNCLFVIGGMVGAFTSKFVADYFGRKRGILFHALFIIIGSVLVFIAPYIDSPECVIISRLFFGVHGGMSCGLIPTYLAEISPSNLRGATGVFHQLFITIGILVAQTLGFRQILGTKEFWHILLALPIVPTFIGSLCLLLFFPETPKALLINKRNELDAKRALQRLRKSSNVSNEIDQMNQESRDSRSDEAISIFQLISLKEFRWPLLTGLVLQLTQQLSGINAIFFYSESIFRGATIQDEYIQYAVFATGFINVISTIICVPLIDRLGRKPLLVFPMIIIIIDFILLTVFLNLKESGQIYSYLSILCIIIFIMSFAVGLGPIPFIYVAECFRQDARSAALAICMFTNWMANFLLTLAFPYLNDLLTTYVFVVFLIVILIALLVIFAKVPETKGRSVEEIMSDFGAKDSSYNADIPLRTNMNG